MSSKAENSNINSEDHSGMLVFHVADEGKVTSFGKQAGFDWHGE